MFNNQKYDFTVKLLEMWVINERKAKKEIMKDSGLSDREVRVLLMAHFLTRKKGLFTKQDIIKTARASPDMVTTVVNILCDKGYIELKIRQASWGGIGARFATTGKADYLANKFTDIIRRMNKEIE